MCGCRELFVRKNFPQVTGFVVVVLAGVVSMYLVLGKRYVISGFVVLFAVALIDFLIYFFTGKCVVCSSQVRQEVSALCDTIVIVARGSVVDIRLRPSITTAVHIALRTPMARVTLA